MECPKCKSTIKVKNGQAHGLQRYKCKACGCNYTKSTPRGKPEAIKKMAIQMYLEGLGYRAIGRLLNVSNVIVLYWVRQAAETIRSVKLWERKHTPAPCIEIDEMWHYIQKNKINFGCGLLTIKSADNPSRFTAVVVVPNRAKSCTQS